MSDDFFDTLDEQVSSEKLPSGNRAIKLPDGTLADPAFCSAASLTRMSPDQYAAVIAWIEAERSRRAVNVTVHEQQTKAFAESQQGRIRFQHAREIEWARKNL